MGNDYICSYENVYTQGMKVVEANIGVLSNNRDLTFLPRYLDSKVQRDNPSEFHFLNSFHGVEKIPFNTEMDILFYILDMKNQATSLNIYNYDKEFFLTGDISVLEKNPLDRRQSIYGNGGILNKIVLLALEKEHNIYSWHATTLYDKEKNHMIICIGPPGAGKTILLLQGILYKNYKVFSTELTHFNVKHDQITFYKGSLYDTVRLGNIIEDFPGLRDELAISVPKDIDLWETKRSVNFEPYQTEDDIIINPNISIIFPKIESEKKSLVINEIRSTSKLVFKLYFNASEKINTPRLLYGVLPYTSFDNNQLAQKRHKAMEFFVNNANILNKISIYGGVKNAWPL